MTRSALDDAHAAMEAAPDDDLARLRFFERLADAELFLLLESEPEGDAVEPQVFPVDGQSYVLLFDREERLTAFAEGPAAYAGLSGRSVIGLLARQGLGIGLNLGVAPSSMLLGADAVDWLAETLATKPDELNERPEEVRAPAGVPEVLIAALDTKLALAQGRARFACLAGVSYAGGRKGHLLALIDPVPGAESALAEAVREAVVFSGVEAGVLDVAFFQSEDPLAATLMRHGLRFDIPDVVAATPTGGSAPGMDPARPPRLK